MTTELAKGKSLEAAYKITDKDITDALGGLPENKLHCSVLGADALKAAIDSYRQRP
jgi:nitrogen fixation NifU-like protein